MSEKNQGLTHREVEVAIILLKNDENNVAVENVLSSF